MSQGSETSVGDNGEQTESVLVGGWVGVWTCRHGLVKKHDAAVKGFLEGVSGGGSTGIW